MKDANKSTEAEVAEAVAKANAEATSEAVAMVREAWTTGDDSDFEDDVWLILNSEGLDKDTDVLPVSVAKKVDAWQEAFEEFERDNININPTANPGDNEDVNGSSPVVCGQEVNTSTDFSKLPPATRQYVTGLSPTTQKNYMKRNSQLDTYLLLTDAKGGITCEANLCNYMVHLSKVYAPSTLWTIYSMINKRAQIEHNLNLKTMTRLQLVMKNLTRGHRATKAATFSMADYDTIFNTLGNKGKELSWKIMILIMFYGMLRSEEGIQVQMQDVSFVNMYDKFHRRVKVAKVSYRGTQKNVDCKCPAYL